MKVSPEIAANRLSCVDQERTSLDKVIVSIVTQLNGLDILNINKLPIPDSTYLDLTRHTSTLIRIIFNIVYTN